MEIYGCFMLDLLYHSERPFSKQWIKEWMGPTVSLLTLQWKEKHSCPAHTNSVNIIAGQTRNPILNTNLPHDTYNACRI